MKLRPKLLVFAEAMERKLREHDKDRGDSWQDETISYLLDRLHEEMGELRLAIESRLDDKAAIASEAADVGNFAAFIYHEARKKRNAGRITGKTK